jgi:hypothetical protein
VQFESLPFHSSVLPNKTRIRELIRTAPLVAQYESALRQAVASISVVTLSAITSSSSISAESIWSRPWLMWQADLLGIDRNNVREAPPLATKGGKVTSAFVYARFGEHVRGLVLTMGGNTFPGRPGCETIARTLLNQETSAA